MSIKSKSEKGNSGNLKASMAVGPSREVMVGNKFVKSAELPAAPSEDVAAILCNGSHVSTQQAGAQMIERVFGKRLHKRGWAAM